MFSQRDRAGTMAEAAERVAVEARDEEIDALVAEFGGDPREAIGLSCMT
jgi:hypothetical protein